MNNHSGVGVGPNASGECTNHLRGPQFIPPVPRMSSPRRVLGFFGTRGQFGFLASMHADACLGYSAMGYQSWEVAGEICDARRFILTHHVGPVAQGRDALPKSLAQKANAGFCLCCVKATHIAVPPSFELGARS